MKTAHAGQRWSGQYLSGAMQNANGTTSAVRVHRYQEGLPVAIEIDGNEARKAYAIAVVQGCRECVVDDLRVGQPCMCSYDDEERQDGGNIRPVHHHEFRASLVCWTSYNNPDARARLAGQFH